MATSVTADAQGVEEIHRILHSLLAESRRLQRGGDRLLQEANTLAIRYWRTALEEKLHAATRRGADAIAPTSLEGGSTDEQRPTMHASSGGRIRITE